MKPTDKSNRTEQARSNFSPATAFPQPGGQSRRQFLQAGATVGFGVAGTRSGGWKHRLRGGGDRRDGGPRHAAWLA